MPFFNHTEWDSGVFSWVMLPMVWASLECWNDFPRLLIYRYRVTHSRFCLHWQPTARTHTYLNCLISEGVYVCGYKSVAMEYWLTLLLLCCKCVVSHRMHRGIWTLLQESKQYTGDSTFTGREEERRGLFRVKMRAAAFAFKWQIQDKTLGLSVDSNIYLRWIACCP